MTKIKIKFGDKNKVNEEIQKALEKRLDNALNDAADYIFTESDRIIRENSFDTGFLAGSGSVSKEFLHKEIGYSALYAPFVEYGTNPHFPPLDAIYTWLMHKRKDLKLKFHKKSTTILNGKTYNKDILNVAWAIAYKMSKHGSEPKPFLRPAFYLVKSQLNEILKKAMKKKI